MKLKRYPVSPTEAEGMGLRVSKRAKSKVAEGKAKLSAEEIQLEVDELVILMLIQAGCDVRSLKSPEALDEAIQKYIVDNPDF